MKNQNGFVLFPVIVIVALVAGVFAMTMPNSVKSEVAKSVGLEK